MMFKKLVLIPGLLISSFACADTEIKPVNIDSSIEAEIITPVTTDIKSAMPDAESVTSEIESAMPPQIAQALALDSLLQDENMKLVYDALDNDQKDRFSQMMFELSSIIERTIVETEMLMEKNKDIQEVWRAVGKGSTRFVLTAGFQKISPE